MRRNTRRGGKLTHEQRYLVPGYNEIVDIESNPDHPLNQVIFDYIIKQRPSRPDLASNPNGYLQSIYGDEKTQFQAFLQSLDAPPALSYSSKTERNIVLNRAKEAMVQKYLKTNPQPKQAQPTKPVLNYEVYTGLPNNEEMNENTKFLIGKPNKSTIKNKSSKNKTKRSWLQYLAQRPGKVARSLVSSTRNTLRDPITYL